jgi:membrane-bound serine protease (ClpP class)
VLLSSAQFAPKIAMNFLIDPNVSYVLLIIGFITAVLALFSPGTGILELGALAALGLAGYGIANLPIRSWALAIMAFAAIPFLLTFFKQFHPQKRLRVLLTVLSALDFLIGSALLYQRETQISAVSPILILFLSPVTLAFTWLITSKILDASETRPVFDPDTLVGMTGQASSDIRGQGTVYINGEEWSAFSKSFIPTGTSVRIIQRDGLILEVEPVTP